ncbi:L-rhamnose mutarotase [Solimonas marina]|uniref:L-rhamnose mutarotase n=1 Tax=Solimonas marina TaxID=2714601 RepID=A0A969WBC8_9GAMM|nr:L-rhamnose mutarotase [Solimonas marina]NKF24047.1 L-rhamnose mutarotase [Solimonas marina]
MRQCLVLDLKDDPQLIAEYEAHHQRIWPEITEHLRGHGVTQMQIYRLGTRLFMVMETDGTRFDAQAFAGAERDNPVVQRWEALMDRFQAPTPWTEPGRKWTPAALIFDLAAQ